MVAIVQPGVRQQTGEGQSLSQCGTNLYLFTKATIFQVPEKSRGEEKKKRREKEEEKKDEEIKEENERREREKKRNKKDSIPCVIFYINIYGLIV